MNEELTYQICTVPQYLLSNRRNKRAISIEYGKIMEVLAPIEDIFLERLFIDDTDYPDLYSELLRAYELNVEWIETYHRPRYFTIDPYYFFKMYHPLEKL
jgi:hypothetical protein